MTNLLHSLNTGLTHAAIAAGGGGEEERFTYRAVESADVLSASGAVGLVPILAAVGALICLFLLFKPGNIGGGKTRLPAYAVFGLLGVGFFATLISFLEWSGGAGNPVSVKLFDWISTTWNGQPEGGGLKSSIGFYMDGLSWLWMLFVTGLASMICLYASEYMQGDKGYCRFFAAFALFVASMACLVMGDNLVLLYLGWEGVGLCSYMLIGYFYTKPAAVAAAKKAFIVNRVGDLFLALGIYLIFVTFGTVEYDALFGAIANGTDAQGNSLDLNTIWQGWAIPLLLIGGAFGKSAQFPLYVWLPDAMEGPTPVSALIHAATMVTAGLYLIARMFPLFVSDESQMALHAVAWIGTFTALFAATIGMAQFDIKRIMAYSTLSQLGYMFAGLGFLTTTGAAYHVFTHAFFKATLFLACGAVMHGFAGQLDLRKLSGLWRVPGWRIVSIAMLIGCLNLAGVPFTAGYFSKDMILAEAFYTPDSLIHWSSLMGWILLLTAGLTAYYTFRVFFRVFVGPVEYEPGDEAHDHDHEEAGEESHHPVEEHGDHHSDHFHPHAPGWAINLVLVVLAVGSVLAAGAYFVKPDNGGKGWVGGLLKDSSAHYKPALVSSHGGHGEGEPAHTLTPAMPHQDFTVSTVSLADESHGVDHYDGATLASGTILGMDPHTVMYYISAVFGAVGILIAAFLHGPKGLWGLGLGTRTEAATSRADRLLPYMGPIAVWAQNKWYVDEFYGKVIVLPLRVISYLFKWIDELISWGIKDGVGAVLGQVGGVLSRRTQQGVLQGYAVSMAAGVGVLLLVVWMLSS